LKAFDFSQLLKNIPELNQLDCTISSYSFERPIDSSTWILPLGAISDIVAEIGMMNMMVLVVSAW